MRRKLDVLKWYRRQPELVQLIILFIVVLAGITLLAIVIYLIPPAGIPKTTSAKYHELSEKISQRYHELSLRAHAVRQKAQPNIYSFLCSYLHDRKLENATLGKITCYRFGEPHGCVCIEPI